MADAPAEVPKGDIYQNYDSQGALNGMFAPAYIAGWKPSNDAVAKWQGENFGLTEADLDATRGPPQANSAEGLPTPYGGGSIPLKSVYGDARGPIDPAALRAYAQGGKYNMGARRDAIAAAMLANNPAPAVNSTPAAPSFDQDYWRMRNYEINSMNGGNY